MRTVFALSVLILIFCVGCPPPVPEPDGEGTNKSIVTPDFNKPEPLIEPLVPRVAPPADATPLDDVPLEGTPPEKAPEETTSFMSDVLGKYAADIIAAKAVPLPPVEDLTTQIEEYIIKMGESLEFLDGSPRYVADSGDIVRDANALALIALALGLAETDSKYKKSAAHIILATQNLAAAQTLEEGQKAYKALQASLAYTETGKPLSWSDKVSNLTPAMKALPNLSSAIKRVTNTPRKLALISDKSLNQVFAQTATMAVISQGTIPNVTETTKPDAIAEWKKHCEEFRDAAIKVNAVTRQYAKDRNDEKDPDYAVFDAAFKAMITSCDDCHKEFYPKAVGMQ